MKRVSIVNVTSYTGLELLRLLAGHPGFEVTSVTGRSQAGKRLGEVFPQLAVGVHMESVAGLVVSEEPEQTDLAFVCLPHAAAAESVVKLLERGVQVVDLSADFRLRDVGVYEEWYKHTHPAPGLLESAVYGLCERYREQTRGARLVANPGCHATTAILALLPALAQGLVGRDIIIDSKTGISGAGRGLTLGTHYAEANEDVSAYGLDGHRHMPEIAQELEAGARDAGRTFSDGLRLTFVPHLMPMTRGILATCYADLRDERLTTRDVTALFAEYYAHEMFVRVVDAPPHTKWTYGSNACLIHPLVDQRTGRLIVVACLDNLVKGAAGQAVQNANLLCGFEEHEGLPRLAVYP